MFALFQEDVLKLFGDILEDVYGPLSDSETVNGVVRSTCAASELMSVNVTGNSADSYILVNSSSQLCEPAAANVADVSTVVQQPPVEVGISDVQPSNVCDINIHSAVANSLLPSKPSDLMSDVGSHPAVTARDWSAGTLQTDGSRKSVEVNVAYYVIFSRMLARRDSTSQDAVCLSHICVSRLCVEIFFRPTPSLSPS